MTSQKERMLAGELYIADDEELAADHIRARLLVERFNASSVTEVELRRSLLRELLGHIGMQTDVKPPLQCDYGYQVSIGDRSFVNYGAVLLDVATITIGDDVQLATNVQLLTATHPLDAETRIARWESGEPITVESGAWLGGGVIVCPGVTVGANTVVGAGSVVTRDLPQGVLAVGNPCRPIRDI
jgi:maltose O-acetyltransferase